ncbi:MAG TPA: hypothetical protein VMG11_06285 [Steroidobacteraceae bacterium]|nr:hypothetical protein [Steroidobacteraceae bacterium]
MRLALQAAEAAHVPRPFASVLRDNFLEGMATGQADHDWAAIARIIMRRAGFERG